MKINMPFWVDLILHYYQDIRDKVIAALKKTYALDFTLFGY